MDNRQKDFLISHSLNLVDDRAIIKQLGSEGVYGFVYNVNTLKEAPNVAVLCFHKGRSDKL